jgi:hypothetical protein
MKTIKRQGDKPDAILPPFIVQAIGADGRTYAASGQTVEKAKANLAAFMLRKKRK